MFVNTVLIIFIDKSKPNDWFDCICLQIGRMGVVVENKTQQCNQLMSCAADGWVPYENTIKFSKLFR